MLAGNSDLYIGCVCGRWESCFSLSGVWSLCSAEFLKSTGFIFGQLGKSTSLIKVFNGQHLPKTLSTIVAGCNYSSDISGWERVHCGRCLKLQQIEKPKLNIHVLRGTIKCLSCSSHNDPTRIPTEQVVSSEQVPLRLSLMIIGSFRSSQLLSVLGTVMLSMGEGVGDLPTPPWDGHLVPPTCLCQLRCPQL